MYNNDNSSNFFDDGKKKIDFVIVINRSLKSSENLRHVVGFLFYLKQHGLEFKIDRGQITDVYYICINLPQTAIEHFAYIYNINVETAGHNFIPVSTIDLKMFTTPLTENSRDIFQRMSVKEPTNKERILIAYEVLKEAKYGDDDNEVGIEKLINLGCIKAAFPVHDGRLEDYTGKEDDTLNDRQLLAKYWANFSLWYKTQPLNLVEKYFGSEVAFYFAWCGFYNRMLIPAAVVGVVCFTASIVQVVVSNHARITEVCESNITLCPLCYSNKNCFNHPLSNSCRYTIISVVFDNYATVVFAVFMSFWATVFLNLWTRQENLLKIRWNVEFVELDTRIRLDYKERAKHKRVSPITGKLEPYVSVKENIFYYVLTYGICSLLIVVVLIAVFGVIMYRLTIASLIRMSNNKYLKYHTTFIIMVTSSILQVIFIKLFGRFYVRLSEWMTFLENPRTQTEFDNSVVHKRYILAFANNYSSLFYIAFLKGRFYTPFQHSLTNLENDICDHAGCILALCVQLMFVMLLKSLLGNILTLITPKIMNRFRKATSSQDLPQWEEEFEMDPAGRYLLTTEFMEMIIQYGFVTFFAAAFPLAPLCALINNILELRLDAYKMVKRHRRPIPKQNSGIGPWSGILRGITHLSVATNALVLAFTSEFVTREIYKRDHHSLEGYVLSTLSVYDMKEVGGNPFINNGTHNTTLCYYPGSRYPPDHPKKYQLTSDFWFEVGMRLVCVIVFEHVTMLLNGFLGYFIPDVPFTVKESLNFEKSLEREMKYRMMAGSFGRRSKSNVVIRRTSTFQ